MDRLLNNNRIHHHHLFDLNTPATAGDGSTTTSTVAAAGATNSSSGSTTSSLTRILRHPGLHFTSSSSYSTHLSSTQTLPPQNDSLARILMDPSFPSIPLSPHYQPWTIHLPHLTLGPAFAQGAFGKLYRGAYRGADVAIKLLEKPENDPERGQLMEQQFGQEVMMLANLKHVNIVRFVGACRKEGVWCIVTEYAKGGSVRQSLARRQSGWIPVRVAVRQALDVARGMEYVHGMGFIHRDLKSDNLLICGDKSIKIADFGVARIEVQTEGMTPETGTYRWMAPEMIQHRPYTQKVDVYSFGIVLWELITGSLPFPNMTAVQAAFAVVNKGARPTIPSDCLPILRDLMTRCWDANPEVRPSFTEVVRILEVAQGEIGSCVRKARFRCCMSDPMTID